MRVIFLSKYSTKGASARYRFFQYFPYFEREQMQCAVSPLFDDEYLSNLFGGRRRIRDVARAVLRRVAALIRIAIKRDSLLVIHGELFPYFPAILERFLSFIGVSYVLDYDDALFHQYDQHRLKTVRWLLSDKIAPVMGGAEAVIAGNGYIADYAQRSGARRVEVIPTVIDLDKYAPAISSRSVDHVFTIGWIGSPSTSEYLKLIEPALASFCRKHTARVVAIGSKNLSFPGVPLEIVPWAEETEVGEMLKFDVGIMPLSDDPWARGKCGFKLIQYMACGLPVIASPVGVNCEIVEEGTNGFLATTTAEWLDALNVLHDDVDLRMRMGKAGRRKVAAEYCLQVTGPRLARLLREVWENWAGSPPPSAR